MTTILRDPIAAQDAQYDLIVIGAGILGISLFSEASAIGLKTLLIERDDFAGGASLNSLRILHGGLRYLQSADLPRFAESVGARRWLAQQFPGMVEPLPCVLLLRNEGLHRPSILRVALAANDLLSWRRNARVAPEGRIGRGRIISAAGLGQLFPDLQLAGIHAGAQWFDLRMTQPVRLSMELLRRGCELGGTALNYTEARSIRSADGRAVGVRARDELSGRECEFSAPSIVNATGPWAAATADRLGLRSPEPLPLTLAWNALVNCPAPGPMAIAVSPPAARSSRSYVIVPRGERMLIGTGQAPATRPQENPQLSEGQVDEFLGDIAAALPGLEFGHDDIEKLFTGLVPASAPGSADFRSRPWIVNHGAAGGPAGVISAATIKYTTARPVALRILRSLGVRGRASPPADGAQAVTQRIELARTAQDPSRQLTPALLEAFRSLQSAVSADDLVYRRLGVIDDVRRAAEIVERLRAINTGVEKPPTGHFNQGVRAT